MLGVGIGVQPEAFSLRFLSVFLGGRQLRLLIVHDIIPFRNCFRLFFFFSFLFVSSRSFSFPFVIKYNR